MKRRKESGFSEIIRERRRQLNLTQQEVARRIKTSTPYVGHMESGKRHPSDKVLSRLAGVLGLDQRELFFLANPVALEMVKPKADSPGTRSAWEDFRKDDRFHRQHNITVDELKMLSQVAMMGEVSSPRDFFYILNTIRHALGR